MAVVRVSGPDATATMSALSADHSGTPVVDPKPPPPPRRLVRRRLADPITGELLDDALVVFMPGGTGRGSSSYTGEDVVEYHLHGSPAVVRGICSALSGLGIVPAEGGEFTKRAFENGRLDLLGVEAVSDLVRAPGADRPRLVAPA